MHPSIFFAQTVHFLCTIQKACIRLSFFRNNSSRTVRIVCIRLSCEMTSMHPEQAVRGNYSGERPSNFFIRKRRQDDSERGWSTSLDIAFYQTRQWEINQALSSEILMIKSTIKKELCSLLTNLRMTSFLSLCTWPNSWRPLLVQVECRVCWWLRGACRCHSRGTAWGNSNS